MSDERIISYRECPYCGDRFIREDQELVCEKCAPELNADMAIQEINISIDVLQALPNRTIRGRKDIIIHEAYKLLSLVK